MLTGVKEILFPDVWPRPEPDPEELSAFTDLYGSLRFLLTFQVILHLQFGKLNKNM